MSIAQAESRLTNAKNQLTAYVDQLDAKYANAPAESMTNDEQLTLNNLMRATKDAAAALELERARTLSSNALSSNNIKALMNALMGADFGADFGATSGPPEGYLRLSAKSALSQKAGESRQSLVKSLVSSAFDFGVQTSTQPVVSGRPATSLLDVLPSEKLDKGNRTHTYLRQTVRTNNAAPVAPGAVKPTSIYTMTPEEGRLKVIAHLSEPMNQYDLEDNRHLVTFIEDELTYGLGTALTAQIVAGDGTGENFTGLTVAEGTQVQPYHLDPILTARAGLTKLETVGLSGLAYVLNPIDWEDIETATITSGEFLLQNAGAPLDRVERRLWGVRVVLDNAIAAGSGLLIAEDSAHLVTDGRVKIEWAMVADDFNRNVVRARCEGRFDLAIERPLGVVELDLTAA